MCKSTSMWYNLFEKTGWAESILIWKTWTAHLNFFPEWDRNQSIGYIHEVHNWCSWKFILDELQQTPKISEFLLAFGSGNLESYKGKVLDGVLYWLYWWWKQYIDGRNNDSRLEVCYMVHVYLFHISEDIRDLKRGIYSIFCV